MTPSPALLVCGLAAGLALAPPAAAQAPATVDDRGAPTTGAATTAPDGPTPGAGDATRGADAATAVLSATTADDTTTAVEGVARDVRVLVLPPEVTSELALADAELVTALVAAELARHDGLAVVSTADTKRMLELAVNREMVGCRADDGDDCHTEIAALLGAELLVVTRARREGERTVVALTLLDATTMHVRARAEVDGRTTLELSTRLRAAVGQLTAPILGHGAPPLPPLVEVRRMGDARALGPAALTGAAALATSACCTVPFLGVFALSLVGGCTTYEAAVVGTALPCMGACASCGGGAAAVGGDLLVDEPLHLGRTALAAGVAGGLGTLAMLAATASAFVSGNLYLSYLHGVQAEVSADDFAEFIGYFIVLLAALLPPALVAVGLGGVIGYELGVALFPSPRVVEGSGATAEIPPAPGAEE